MVYRRLVRLTNKRFVAARFFGKGAKPHERP